MNSEVKTEWLAALRDGTRPQGKRYLIADGKYCCLGVLCELAAEHGVVDAVVSVYGDRTATTFDGQESSIPGSVQQWAGIPAFGNSRLYDTNSLAYRNDEGESFESIADWVEENL